MEKIKKFIISQTWLTADLVTYLRLFFFSPLVIFFSLKRWYLVAFILFFLGLLTDALDGFIARLKNQSKEGGTIFDAGADKVFILIPFLILGLRFLNQTTVIWILTLEIFHVLLVFFNQALGLPLKIVVNLFIRLKMWFLGLIVGFLLLTAQYFAPLSSIFLYFAIATSVVGIFIHLVKAINMLTYLK